MDLGKWKIDDVALLCQIVCYFWQYCQLLEDELTAIKVPGDADNASAVTRLGIRSFSSEQR
jgi:hypothetical protein